MRFQPITHRVLVLPAIAAVAGLALAGCGSSSPPKSQPTSTPTSTGTAMSSSPSGSSSAESAIKTNWVAFFSAKTPTTQRVALLEDGSEFSALIAAQSKNSLASTASATVNSVSDVTSTQATVTYTINALGSPVLTNQKGTAVYQDGTWKVGLTSFCGLLTLEKSSGAVSLPALPSACSSSS
jgi:hypothetical protein